MTARLTAILGVGAVAALGLGAATHQTPHNAPQYAAAVTQANIASTICVKGYTATVRPPLSYTAPLKRRLLAALPPTADHNAGDYELDHVVPLEVGGNPRNPANLRLELWPEARAKDLVENRVHQEVCDRQISLAAGRRCFLTDWKACP